MSSVGGTTQADLSAQAWRGEATAAAEAYVEEQAAQAARERDEAEQRAAAQAQQAQPSDGVDPPPVPGNDGLFPPATGPRAGAGTGAAAGATNQAIQFGTPIKLSDETVKEYRELGLTVTSAGDGKYIINAPNNPAHDVYVTEKAPLEAPDNLPQLAPETPLPGRQTPTTGAAPNSDVDGGASVESKPPVDPNKVVTDLGEKVDKIVNDIPLLKNQLRELKEAGWKVEFGKAGVGGLNHDDKIIYIDPSLKEHPAKVAAVLAHEVGHARHPVADVSKEGLTKEEYVKRRTEALLDSEGAAALDTVRYQESARNNGSDLDIAGFQDDTYRDIYNQLRSKQISEDEAIHRAGQVHGDNELHGDSRVTYRDHFTQTAEKDWESPPKTSK